MTNPPADYRALAAELARALEDCRSTMKQGYRTPRYYASLTDAKALLSRPEVKALLDEPALSGPDKPAEPKP